MVGRRTLAEVGEFELIAALTHDLQVPPNVTLGVGDDCAVFAPSGQVAVSTDAMVEDVHFKRVWSGPHDIGRKAVASAVADLEAMGARPVGLVVSLSAPGETQVDWVVELAKGIREECDRCGAALVGGDVTRGPVVSVVVTVFGDLEGRTPVVRSGARPGDVVAFVGRLGMAAAGLAVLGRGFRSPGAVVRAHRVPEPPYGQGIVAADAGATAMIDCSDGLLADLGHVARASGVSIDLVSAAFDVDEAQKTVAAAIGGGDPMAYILTGGDDHALLATFPGGSREEGPLGSEERTARGDLVPPGWTVIGRVAEGDPAVTVDGKAWQGQPGWRHF